MASIPLLVLASIALCGAKAAAGGTVAGEARVPLSRSGFPAGFIFGTASSAYQYEGAAREDGRGPCIWDKITHDYSGLIADRSNGDVAVDFYHRYKEDVKLMKDLRTDAFRFSISWTRILPNGSLSGGVNREGIKFYNNLIDELISNGLKPFATLFHFDTPESLQEQYGAFASPRIVDDFREFASICFKEYGDRVKHWITLNEPAGFSASFTSLGGMDGNPPRTLYLMGHHFLLSHASAVDLYRKKYQATQKGIIGITLDTKWVVPLSNSKADSDAAERYLDFSFGWFMDPLTYGDYPFNMKILVGDRLPGFNKEQSELVKGSYDFIGINYYTSRYVYSLPISEIIQKNYSSDSYTNISAVRNGVPIGPLAGSVWVYMYPRGIKNILEYTKNKYNNPVIYITENGILEVNNATLSLEEALKDDTRIYYHKQHLLNVQNAMRKGVNVRGYFAWSLLDNFEWTSGYTVRFGIHYVDYKNGLKRYPKSSAYWFKDLLQK